VLEEHTERHLRLIRKGGVDRYVARNDGAYTLRPGASYSTATEGRIPRNLMPFVQSKADKDLQRARAIARAAGLPVHGAGMPLELAAFLVRYLCPPGGLVAEPFWGYGTSGMAAEINDCPWIASELMGEYLVGSAPRFARRPGFTQYLT
jgi:site-specific DNA-methyltransferase (cytosine-N4-specific)